MAEQTPQEIQNTLGITSITLRRWCDYHKAYLSTGTQPRNGQARRFTGRDLEVLRHVQSLRDQGMTTVIINEHLSTLTFAEIDNAPNDTTLAIVDAPEQPRATPAALVTVDTIVDIQRQIATLQQSVNEGKQAPAPRGLEWFSGFGFGFVAALLFVVVILGLAVLYGGFR